MVDRAVEAVDGKIVVAAVNGELVVKRLRQAGGTATLVSENSDYGPIEVSEQDEVFVWGVVVGSVRLFS